MALEPWFITSADAICTLFTEMEAMGVTDKA